jgi:hypothetical protein
LNSSGGVRTCATSSNSCISSSVNAVKFDLWPGKLCNWPNTLVAFLRQRYRWRAGQIDEETSIRYWRFQYLRGCMWIISSDHANVVFNFRSNRPTHSIVVCRITENAEKVKYFDLITKRFECSHRLCGNIVMTVLSISDDSWITASTCAYGIMHWHCEQFYQDITRSCAMVFHAEILRNNRPNAISQTQEKELYIINHNWIASNFNASFPYML